MSIDLSNYVRVAQYDLPEPTRTTAPAGNLLAQEASGVTYNWDTDTLFVVGDGGTSVTEVSLTGGLVSTMTLAAGSSPQGTEFYDIEGITYVGGGQFVFTEERYRQLVKFTYAAGTTLTRDHAQTVDLGTDIGNIGNEGVSYDPQTGGFVVVKEISPQGIFQTNVDFAAGTATNGSSTTVMPTNLFDPALAGLGDMSDVYTPSSNAKYFGTTDQGNLLILSQESGKVVEVDRAGSVLSSLTLQAPATPTGLNIQAMTVEGITMGPDGTIYIVNEEGGGDFNHPQLWVYKPSSAVNTPPSAIALANALTSIVENTNTGARVKVADINLTDDGIGTNNFTVTGTDAAFFEADASGLYIKAGVSIDYETKTSYSVTVNVDDPSSTATPDASVSYTLAVTNVVNEGAAGSVAITEAAPWSSGIASVGADWFELTNTGNTAIDLTGWKMDDNSFAFASAVALNGITSLAPGESAIFLESATPTTTIANFVQTWFNGTKPANLQIGTYTGSGVGLSTGGDGVAVFNASGVEQARVSFGAATTAAPFRTFDNSAGTATVSTLSTVGTNGAFAAANDANEIGSPGSAGGIAAPVNKAPTAIGLSSEVTQIDENTSTAARIKVANVLVTDDGLGTNTLGLTGADAAFFEVDATGLYLKAGTHLDFEAKASYAVTVTVDDTTIGNTPDATVSFTLNVKDVLEPIRVTEVAPWSSGNGPVGSDWFEITNTGSSAVDITGWKMDDNSFAFANAVALSGVTSLAPGEAAIFLEIGATQNAATVIQTFIQTWFGGTKPAGLQIGTYSGSGVGLSTGGDGVALYDASGNVQAKVSFGAATTLAPLRTFDNAAGLDHAAITQLSTAGVNGAFIAAGDATETGSPGYGRVNDAPVITSDLGGDTAAVSVAENVAAVTTVTSTDANGDARTYAITGGADAALFTINQTTGALSFIKAPNFERAADADKNNVYDVIVSASDGVATDTQHLTVTVTDVADTHSSQTPYLVSTNADVSIQALITTGDATSKTSGGTYLFGGIPDGLGLFDNGDGTVTILVNHEIGSGLGAVRDHGAKGAYVSQLVVDKTTLEVISGQDAIQTLKVWDAASSSWQVSTTALNRFCSADLPSQSALYNPATGLGSQAKIYFTGEEAGAEGKLLGVVVTGSEAGTAYDLPWLGKFSHENAVANPFAQDKTIVMGTDDAGGGKGQVYVYIGTKQATGNEVQKAGLTGGQLYGIAVTGLTQESGTTNLQNAAFTLAPLGDVSGTTGAALETASNTAGVTQFLRPEDIAWDPTNAARGYFVVTDNVNPNGSPNSPTQFHSRLYQFTFSDITDPTKGGTITAVLDGTEGQVMFDNITVDFQGKVTLSEDPGNNPRVAKVWQYDPATDTLTELAQHDPSRFLAGGANFLTQDEESSGTLDVTATFGDAHHKAFLITTQNHAAASGPNATTLVEGGQLQLIKQYYNDAPTLTGTAATLAHGLQQASYTVNASDLLAGYTDANGDTLSVANLTASNGTVANNGNGTYTITLDSGFTGTMTLGYKVSDGLGGLTSASASVVIDAFPSQSYTGTAGANTFTSAASINWTINTLGGIDTIDVGAGNDTVNGGAGNDLISTGAGNDVILVDPNGGFDAVNGGSGIDVIRATEDAMVIGLSSLTGVEAISGGEFSHVGILGSGAADTLDFSGVTLSGITGIDGGSGNDTITGSIAADSIYGGLGNDVLGGNDGNDTIDGGIGNDILLGGAGNDILTGGAGKDTMYGEADDDTFVIGASAGKDTIDGGTGNDTVVAGADGVVFNIAAIENVETFSSGGFANVTIAGSSATETIDLSAATLTGITLISGGGGVDTITGSNGNDTIDGGTANDILNGGDGDDVFLVGLTSGKDTIDGGSGSDTVLITSDNLSLTTGAWTSIEAIDASGRSGVKIVGSTAGDMLNFTGVALTNIAAIDGGAGNDTITGSAGDDTIIGGAGADVLAGGGGNDRFVFRAVADSRPGVFADHIADFQTGDVIDLSGIDADAATAGIQHFTFIGANSFTGVGQLQIGVVDGKTALFGNTAGSSTPEFSIILDNNHTVVASDLVLI